MHIWSILLINSDIKRCIHLGRSLSIRYLDYDMTETVVFCVAVEAGTKCKTVFTELNCNVFEVVLTNNQRERGSG